ncbi:MAG: hypothetical protein B7733_22295 [Myxococcales bacterium FL481]|nr:MAG: hypothetical protein B7733_22295 [Myxococcales bacterium FL481]
MLLASAVAFALATRLAVAPVTPAPARDEAAAAFRLGIEAFEARDFAVAAQHFERAQGLAPHPATLYNLALALEQAGEILAAWQAYLDVERTGLTEADREEAGRDRRRLENRLAVLELYAEPHARLCLDGSPIPQTGEGRFRTATGEGDHDLVLDQHAMPITLLRGHTRVLHLQDLEQFWGPGAKQPSRQTLAIHAAATSAGVLSLGLASAALARRDGADDGNGLLTGALVAGGVAALAGVAAGLQLFQTRQENAAAPAPQATDGICPLHPALAAPTAPPPESDQRGTRDPTQTVTAGRASAQWTATVASDL